MGSEALILNFNHVVLFLATRETVVVSRRSIGWFRHLNHQNLSTGDDFIHSRRKNHLVPFLDPREAVAPLANDPIMLERSIQLFRHLEPQNVSIISDSID